MAPWLLILGLVAFEAAANWLWLTKNVVIPGWDRPGHLGRSLAYNATLTPLSWQGLFKASVQDPIRPPLPFASAVPLYWLFGTSSDVATMTNVVWWLILLASVYGFGVHLGGRRLGVWGTILTALTPLLYALSRSFYGEFTLTAMVALTLYLLVAGEAFRRPGASVSLGIALGLGMLTTRTYPVFVAGPLLVVLLRSDALRSLWQRLRGGLRISVPELLIALGAGLGLAGLWYFSNQAQARELGLDWWLFPAWAGLVTVTIYLLLLKPRDPGVNCLSALSLGGTLASLWYLPRVQVFQRILRFGYGVGDPRQRKLDLSSLHTYTYYPRTAINEGLGLVLSVLLAAALVGVLAWLIRRRGTWHTLWQTGTGWIVLLLWPAIPCVLLTLSIYQESRAFAPALPGLALILAAGLLAMPWKRLNRALLALAVVWALVQFVVISYAETHGPALQTQFRLPILGPSGLFARGAHLELPDAGDTDPGYNIQPDVLARMDVHRRALGRSAVRLGVLARTAQVNANSFVFPAAVQYPGIEIVDLASDFAGDESVSRLYGHEFLLLKRNNKTPDEQARAAMERIFDHPPQLLLDTFALEATYVLPDGDKALLYRLRYWPDPALSPDDVAQASQLLARDAHPDDGLLLCPPELLASLSQAGMQQTDVQVLPPSAQRDATARKELERMVSEHRRLFVLCASDESDDFVQSWLNRYAYPAGDRWLGSLRLSLYGTTPLPPPEQATRLKGVSLGDGIELTGIDLSDGSLHPGEVVPLTLFWRARKPVSRDWTVFVHLLDSEGRLVAQHDDEPGGGQRPTTSWQVNEAIVDRHGVLLPDDLPAGEYRLIAGLYDPGSGERLAVTGDSASPGDPLLVGSILVAP